MEKNKGGIEFMEQRIVAFTFSLSAASNSQCDVGDLQLKRCLTVYSTGTEVEGF